jgi:hypothetical protein
MGAGRVRSESPTRCGDEREMLVLDILIFRNRQYERNAVKPVVKQEEQITPQRAAVGKRLAQILSELFNPLVVALPTFLGIARVSAPDLLHALLWWVVAVLGVCIAPTLFVLRGVRSGRYTDHHVSVREQRLIPLLFGVACVVIAFVLLLALHAARPLIATMTAVIVVLLLATLITRFWKISLPPGGRHRGCHGLHAALRAALSRLVSAGGARRLGALAGGRPYALASGGWHGPGGKPHREYLQALACHPVTCSPLPGSLPERLSEAN